MIGRVLGNYRLTAKIGEGGMGAVYRAVDEMLDREVAIKAIRPDLAREPQIVERFRSEARLLARVQHPAIATIYSFFPAGEDGTELFLAMEYVPGRTLAEVLAGEGAMPAARAVRLLGTALDGIQQAHEAGIIHRDLKPDNLMLTEGERLKVMDFGIARMAGSSHLTRTGLLVGTLRYMAPEQIRGEEVDQRTDVYALGIVLYQMLTGRVPFDGTTDYSILRAQLEDPPPPPRSLAPAVPPEVERVVLRALAKEPAERFASIADLHRALRLALPPSEATGIRESPVASLTSTLPLSRPRRRGGHPAARPERAAPHGRAPLRGDGADRPHPGAGRADRRPSRAPPSSATAPPAAPASRAGPGLDLLPPDRADGLEADGGRRRRRGGPGDRRGHRLARPAAQGGRAGGRRARGRPHRFKRYGHLWGWSRLGVGGLAGPGAGAGRSGEPAPGAIVLPASGLGVRPAGPRGSQGNRVPSSPSALPPATPQESPNVAAETPSPAPPPAPAQTQAEPPAAQEPEPAGGLLPGQELRRLASSLVSSSAHLGEVYQGYLDQKDERDEELTANDNALRDEMEALNEAAERFDAFFNAGFLARTRNRLRRPNETVLRNDLLRRAQGVQAKIERVDQLMGAVAPSPEVRQAWSAVRAQWQRARQLVTG